MDGWSDKRVVVLGGAGFVGSHLCERLLALEARRVVAVDNFLTGRPDNVKHLQGDARFQLRQVDISEPGLDVEGEVDFVLNLASPASPIDYEVLWLQTMRTGALGTQHALELAERKGAVFLQASTSEVYGDPLEHPQREAYVGHVDCTKPRAVYDEAKRYAEALIAAWRRKRGVSTRVARIFNTYGPRMRLDDGRVVPAFIGQALAGADFTVFGDGSQTRSFCYVSDLVEGLLKLAASGEPDPVNLGNPDERTILDFALAVRAAAGGGGEVKFRPLPVGDPRQRRPDITRARTLLGWEPTVPLDEGLRRTVAYFRGTR